MNYARNYKNVLNFVKVMPKILVVPFFSGHGVHRPTAQTAYVLSTYNTAEDTVQSGNTKHRKGPHRTTSIKCCVNGGEEIK